MNTLHITDRKKFDQQIWQTNTDFTSNKYNKWLRKATKELQLLRDHLEYDCPNDVDANIIGDICNLISSIVIDAEPRGDSWTCTPGDFDDYVTDGIDEDQMQDIVEQVGEDMGNNDCAADVYWQIVEQVAEECGLQKRSDIIKEAKLFCNVEIDYEYVLCSICTKDDHTRMDEIVIALHEFDVTTDDDDQIYFYCGSKEEFIRICKEGADDFIICAIHEFRTSL